MIRRLWSLVRGFAALLVLVVLSVPIMIVEMAYWVASGRDLEWSLKIEEWSDGLVDGSLDE